MIPLSDIDDQVGTQPDSDWQMPNRESCPRPRVWLVDDSQQFRSLLAVILGQEGGFDCSREFACPQAVLAALREETPPDLILLDIQMGPECGLDAIQPIKALAPSTHVIMLTTCFDSLRRSQAQKNGATDFLLKSYSVEQIARRVWQALDQPVPPVEPAQMEPELCAVESREGRFSNHVLPRHRFALWRNAASRMMRSAFFVRSLLTMFF